MPTLAGHGPGHLATTRSGITAVSAIHRIKEWAATIRRDVVAIYLAARDPRTPRLARWLALLIAAYALSPIDLVPDFIPVIGYLDDLLILPLGLLLIRRLLPDEVLADSRVAAMNLCTTPTSRKAALTIVILWVLGAVAFGHWLIRKL